MGGRIGKIKSNGGQKMHKPCPVLFRMLFQIGSEQVLEANLVRSQFRSGGHGILAIASRRAGHRDIN